MQKVIVDASLAEKLRDLCQPVLVCATDGVTIGDGTPDDADFEPPRIVYAGDSKKDQ